MVREKSFHPGTERARNSGFDTNHQKATSVPTSTVTVTAPSVTVTTRTLIEKNIVENHQNFEKVQLKIELDDNNTSTHHQKVHQKETFLVCLLAFVS